MTHQLLNAIQEIIQEDAGGRGLRTDPEVNLVTATAGDFAAACRSLAEAPQPSIAVITGFFIPQAEPPAGETDGPLGALFLARALVPAGVHVTLATDEFCRRALQAGLAACSLAEQVPLVTLPPATHPWGRFLHHDWPNTFAGRQPLTHLIALERVGPSHTSESHRSQPGANPMAVEQFLREVPPEHHDRCHTMRGRDITAHMSPAHLLIEAAQQSPRVTTIGIGDGGNEIGMGKIPWAVIHRNVPGGGRVACRVATDHLIVCGVSNWGAYGLAAGVCLLRGYGPDPDLFDVARERELLRIMVEEGPLVDGMTGKPTVSVDGLPFERYAEPLRRLAPIREERSGGLEIEVIPGKR